MVNFCVKFFANFYFILFVIIFYYSGVVSAAASDNCGLDAEAIDIVKCLKNIYKLPVNEIEIKSHNIDLKIGGINKEIAPFSKEIDKINTNIKKKEEELNKLDQSDSNYATNKANIDGEITGLKTNLTSQQSLIDPLQLKKDKLIIIKDKVDDLALCDKDFSKIYSNVKSSIFDIMSETDGSLLSKNKSIKTIQSCVSTIPDLLPSQADNLNKSLDKSHLEISRAINTLNLVPIDKQSKNPERVRELTEVKDIIETAKNTVSSKRTLDIGWGSDFVGNLYLGFEGSSVSDVKNKSTSRIGLMVYEQSFGDVEFGEDGNYVKKNAPHLFMNLLSTSSAENTTNDELVQSFESDFNMFWPVSGEKKQNGELIRGFILSHGIKKNDTGTDDQFIKKNYLGYRSSYSPEFFYDILLGKTEGLNGHRVEMRGQMPVSEVLTGRVFVGLNINYGVDDSDGVKDSLKLYVTWQTTFTDIFSK